MGLRCLLGVLVVKHRNERSKQLLDTEVVSKLFVGSDFPSVSSPLQSLLFVFKSINQLPVNVSLDNITPQSARLLLCLYLRHFCSNSLSWSAARLFHIKRNDIISVLIGSLSASLSLTIHQPAFMTQRRQNHTGSDIPSHSLQVTVKQIKNCGKEEEEWQSPRWNRSQQTGWKELRCSVPRPDVSPLSEVTKL